jgi:hypothetical protein
MEIGLLTCASLGYGVSWPYLSTQGDRRGHIKSNGLTGSSVVGYPREDLVIGLVLVQPAC